jgi:cobalamin biosynthesis Mg chelatase CobN
VTESRIRKVTLFEDRAEVVRDAKAHAPVGGAWLAFAGMSPYLDDRSVQVRVVSGGGRVLGARVKRKVHHDQAIGREDLEALENVARACARRIRDADSAAARAHAHAEQGRALGERWAAGLVLVPKGFVGERADAWRAAHEQLVRAEADAPRSPRRSALVYAPKTTGSAPNPACERVTRRSFATKRSSRFTSTATEKKPHSRSPTARRARYGGRSTPPASCAKKTRNLG